MVCYVREEEDICPNSPQIVGRFAGVTGFLNQRCCFFLGMFQCSKWPFWCSVRMCVPASEAAEVCIACQVTGGATMMGYWPFQALTLDSKKIHRVSKCREPGDITDLAAVEIALNNLKLGFYSL